ncbi:hypothetical protein [Rhodospirillum sp. A1_3_36]|uniref:hypothetical protein n=1 Tax=Rhodospirillum sp. A1_3_36 TaxID=3391666 RepID=UPI0039A450F1
MRDEMFFAASWPTGPLCAREASDCLKKFFIGFSRVSPWGMPFDVSGTTAKQAHLEFSEDYSDFEEIVFKAMDNKDVRFFSESNPDTMRLMPDSKTVYGFSCVFSDYPQRNRKKNMITINVDLGQNKENSLSSIVIHIPDYLPGQDNMAWSTSDMEKPQAIFDFLIESLGAYTCYLSSNSFRSSVLDRSIDRYTLGWMSYTKNAKVIAALKDDPRTTEYKEGILVKLGDGVSVFEDEAVREEAIKIRDKLRAAGAVDWMAEAERFMPSKDQI